MLFQPLLFFSLWWWVGTQKSQFFILGIFSQVRSVTSMLTHFLIMISLLSSPLPSPQFSLFSTSLLSPLSLFPSSVSLSSFLSFSSTLSHIYTHIHASILIYVHSDSFQSFLIKLMISFTLEYFKAIYDLFYKFYVLSLTKYVG